LKIDLVLYLERHEQKNERHLFCFQFQGPGGAEKACGGYRTLRADRNGRKPAAGTGRMTAKEALVFMDTVCCGNDFLREGFERVACRRFSAAAT